MNPRTRLLAVMLLALFPLALAPYAGAHITVSAPGAVAGRPATIEVRVPTESGTASTVTVRIQLPAELAGGATATAPAGWRVERSDVTVTWIATAGGAPAHQAAVFTVAVDRLPAGTFHFPAVQTYSDGTVASWTERGAPGLELEHPAPTLTVGGPADAGQPTPAANPTTTVTATASAGSPAASPTATPAASPTAAQTDEASSGTLWWVVGAVAILVAAIGVAVAIRRRRN
ncbi:DUF1775 domain-containing protein [Tsukamurella asaccharolytica]|uniref:DUF1775 domain-containing protein n=1 Tax=Tsukamurella asaccharolytica TaxID=2592067 RepID=A0A5C5RBR1_9ACTN|nr:DUF1775 domain-containing protein [Tsukamurella asaccharolytica]TWS19813.1 DUF1775 domain-containing protein [Tsukamurella asaccharolytica]